MTICEMNGNEILLVGKPNVGKSTIFNNLIPNYCFSAVSSKKNTTNNSIIVSSNLCTYIDVPGIVEDNKFKQLIEKQLHISKLILFVTEAHIFNEIDQKILNNINKLISTETIIFWILNKIDLVPNKQKILKIISNVSSNFGRFNEIIPICSYNEKDLERLLNLISKYLNINIEFQKQEANVYNQNNIYIEVIKSKIYTYINKEIPYFTKIIIENIQQKSDITYVNANIIVTKISHKKLLIGSQGSKIKQIRESAELLLNSRLKSKIKLKLWIKIK